MDFRIQGLAPEPFMRLYGLPDGELAKLNAKRYTVDEQPGFPDRIELRDAEPGETVILANYVHQPADTPYRASHAVYVREWAKRRFDAINELPTVLRIRQISVRAFSSSHWMIDAELCAGEDLEPLVQRLLSNPGVDYLQLHFAKRGCYAARIERS
jgi:hypothetical protein